VTARADRLRARIAALPPGLLRTWGAVFAALVVLPPLLTTTRDSEFTAAVEVFPLAQSGATTPEDRTSYVGRLLDSRVVEEEAVSNAGLAIDPAQLPGRIDVRPTERSVFLAATANTPERARDLVNAVAAALANASVRDLRARSRTELADIERRLRSLGLSGFERDQLTEERNTLEQAIASDSFGLVIGPRPEPPTPSGLVDRVVAALPGPFPPKRSPFFAAVVGLVLAAAVCFALYAARSWGSVRSSPQRAAASDAFGLVTDPQPEPPIASVIVDPVDAPLPGPIPPRPRPYVAAVGLVLAAAVGFAIYAARALPGALRRSP
jgi:hypothetical protein